MRSSVLGGAVVLSLALWAGSAVASIQDVTVGPNPFPGFPSPGGTGNGIISGGGFTLTIEKFFTVYGEIPLILDTDRDPIDATDVYSVTERISNDTGVDWLDFHLVLDPIDAHPSLMLLFDNFQVNSAPNPLTFQAVPGALSIFGLIPDGSEISISYDLVASSVGGSNDLFGIHEFPSVDGGVPELSSLVTWVGLALVVTMGITRPMRCALA
jgi:hypothetical protein